MNNSLKIPDDSYNSEAQSIDLQEKNKSNDDNIISIEDEKRKWKLEIEDANLEIKGLQEENLSKVGFFIN